jgi:hypothetical protein
MQEDRAAIGLRNPIMLMFLAADERPRKRRGFFSTQGPAEEKSNGKHFSCSFKIHCVLCSLVIAQERYVYIELIHRADRA